jgi:DNA-binding response OmpR family regulator
MHKILIVEDEISTAEMLSFVLQQEGFTVVTAANGKEALSALEGDGIALVLCDLMMPIMDGRELCRLMKRDAHTETIPIILMSAAPEISVVHLAEEGCEYDSFMRKPLDLDRLTATIKNLVTT